MGCGVVMGFLPAEDAPECTASRIECQSRSRGRLDTPMRADECLAAGDMEGEAVWLRIGRAIEELLSKEPPDDAEVH